MIFCFTKKKNDIVNAKKHNFDFYIKSYLDGHYYINTQCKRYNKNKTFKRISMKQMQQLFQLNDKDWNIIKLYARGKFSLEIIEVLYNYWYNNMVIENNHIISYDNDLDFGLLEQ